jgi:hypothetical protein
MGVGPCRAAQRRSHGGKSGGSCSVRCASCSSTSAFPAMKSKTPDLADDQSPRLSLFSRHLRSMATGTHARRRVLGLVSRSGVKKEVQRLNEGQT